ncbi:uncharacterized protein LOC130994553 [Salvia miltiorrhiza]|uniref:uncharacterized protein LOC130994553 n=1 Tax=Salvia miltiorrhiza TaxID=226208 RepID=UPI0025AC5B02|nr:uncharacterized protein LOC130994553 [Salvia miltiorrhiza]
MLPPARSGKMAAYKLYSPVKGQVVSFFNINDNDKTVEVMQDPATKLVGSSHGWLALYNPRRRAFFLSNPLSGRRIDLPQPPDFLEPIHKVIVSSSPDEDDDCRALMMFSMQTCFYVCRPGRNAWTLLGKFGYEDFVYSAARKRFLCLLSEQVMIDFDDEEEFEPWDLECWSVVQEPEPTIDLEWMTKSLDSELFHKQVREVGACYEPVVHYTRYLVADDRRGRIYVVVRYIAWFEYEKTVGFDVYRIDKGFMKMKGSLDGLVMFVGVNESFAVAASEFPQLQPDSIYYTRDTSGGHDLGIFDYRRKSFSSCYYHRDTSTFQTIHPPPLLAIITATLQLSKPFTHHLYE